ncbi:alpha-ketoacid dehydrogenase subunit alpha/beta [Falsiroseomonas tokyonensis]|uniref:2-oxoglutarate dehydrogenase E1 component n=1 Tax=Falsiroseomonas tokyonensis TaxID=430521 RepID=A0ABV7C2T5_9PROT
MKLSPIATATPWFRLEVEEADWAAEDPADLARWMEQLLLIRRFEEKILELHGAGLIHGPAHASIGQEGGAVGALSVLGTEDKINGTHRAHHQILAKLLNAATPAGYDPRRDSVPDAAQDHVRRTMAEIMGLAQGYNGGRGGSMHMRIAEAGVVGSSAIIGGNVPHAVGYGLADKVLGRENISVAFFGDGTLMAGQTLEAINLAALYRLPVVFFLENNFYAVSTHVQDQTRETRLTTRGAMFGVPSVECDGMDVLAVRRAMQWARDQIAETGGPVFVEAICYRFLHQSGPMLGSQFGYRDKAEEELWRARDPVTTLPAVLDRLGVLDAEGLARLEARVRAVVDQAAEALVETPPGANAPQLRDGLLPEVTDLERGIRGDLSELRGLKAQEASAAVPAQPMKYIDAIAATLLHNMERDPRIVLIGEDIHRLRGGVSGSAKGVMEKFPERVFATPICENGFTGMALGAALCGLRPVVDIMFGDFTIVAADQMFNGIGKFAHMFGGGFGIPLVVRARVSPAAGYGSQHSMDPSGLFAAYPGWRILHPSTPHDYVGLMNAALACEDPVLMIEHQGLFQTSGPVPQDLDYIVNFGKARVVRHGTACTVLTYGAMVPETEAAVAETGIDAEILDLRCLDLEGMDWPAIEASIKRTNRVLIAEQTAHGTAHGARWVDEIQRRCFDWLDAEIARVHGSRAAPVVSRPLNAAALADAATVAEGLRRLMR